MVLKQIMRSAAKKADKAISSAAKVGLKVNKAIDNASYKKMRDSHDRMETARERARTTTWPISSRLANYELKRATKNYKTTRAADNNVAELAYKINKILSKYAK